MRRTFFFLLCSLVSGSLVSCVEPADDDDSAANDDDSASDDDDATPPSLEPCPYAVDEACADVVVDAPGADPEVAFKEPLRATNGVRGLGPEQGGMDVFSLDHGDGASLTLRWSDRRVLNGPGVDFVVFENAFEISGPDDVFMDLAVVELSVDGSAWIAMPHDYLADDQDTYSSDPAHWSGFAGARPTLLHEENNPVAPTSAAAGGDPFDLDDLPDDGALGTTIRNEGFVFLRITSAVTRTNPDTGAPFVGDVISNGPDIDGVYATVLAEAP